MGLISIVDLFNLKGKTAIVTGGAMGIGLGIATRLAEAGAAVILADKDGDAAEKSAELLTGEGYQVTPLAVDVSSEDDVARMVATAVETYGSVDILVNNAGVYPNIPLIDLKVADFQRILDINLKGVFLCTQAIAKQMIKQGNGGRIVNITSIDALHPSMVGLATYDASKHGVWGFTKNAALELAEYKIWVNAIAPGGIRTPGATGGANNQPVSEEQQKQVAAFMQRIPMHRMGEPDDIGKAALFLASDMASYMTGSQIIVDGGVLLS